MQVPSNLEIPYESIVNANIEPPGTRLLQEAAEFDWGAAPLFVSNMTQSYSSVLQQKHWDAASPKSKVLSWCSCACACMLCVCVCFRVCCPSVCRTHVCRKRCNRNMEGCSLV